MQANATMIRAREYLLVLLIFLAEADSFWFTISGETSRDCSLGRRLGFYDKIDYYAFLVTAGLAEYRIHGNGDKELKILRGQWNIMLDILPNKAELFYVTERMFDVESAVAGLTQCRANRGRCSVIRVGVKNKGWHKNIAAQLKKRFTVPPTLNSLQTMQRSFTRNMRRMITDTIINNRDVYDEAIKDDEKKSKRLSTTSQ
jgi:hypothetical protein